MMKYYNASKRIRNSYSYITVVQFKFFESQQQDFFTSFNESLIYVIG